MPKTFQTAYAERYARIIKRVRKEAGLTQEEFASAVDATETSVSRWENAHWVPNPRDLHKICKMFDVPYDTFMPLGLTEVEVHELASYLRSLPAPVLYAEIQRMRQHIQRSQDAGKSHRGHPRKKNIQAGQQR